MGVEAVVLLWNCFLTLAALVAFAALCLGQWYSIRVAGLMDDVGCLDGGGSGGWRREDGRCEREVREWRSRSGD